MNNSYKTRLHHRIPGGAHTYSRGWDQFPANAPEILVSGKGGRVYDTDGNEYLDFGMGLRSVNIGYGEPRIVAAALREMEAGNNLTRASLTELKAAELFCDVITSCDMVKFAKNGSSVTTAAIKLARAFTGRKLVLACQDHPFFSFDDWFIGSTEMNKGVPEQIQALTVRFPYNDLQTLEQIVKVRKDEIACIILEPATIIEPARCPENPSVNWLHLVRELCDKHGIVLIFDEMITGFRFHLKGAQHYYGVKPDLSCFGKAMANGFSLAALGGKREIMALGDTLQAGQERVFLLSSTHGAEMSSLGAFIETIHCLQEWNVVDYCWNFGRQVMQTVAKCAKQHGLTDLIQITGVPCSPAMLYLDAQGKPWPQLRTSFLEAMMEKRVFFSWQAFCYRHSSSDLAWLEDAIDHACHKIKGYLPDKIERSFSSHLLKPVFRRHN